MKSIRTLPTKIGLIFVALAMAVAAQAQWTTSGVDIYTNLGGNVGIGTTTPARALDVYPAVNNRAARISVVAVGDWGAFAGTAGNAMFGHTTSMSTSTGYALVQSSAGQTFLNAKTGQPINFRIAGADRMFLSSAGNFGINTITPGARFEVNGAARITTGSGGKLQLGALNTSTDNFGYVSSASQTNGSGLKFETTNGSGVNTGLVQMVILNNGTVGIGTTTPNAAYKLDVSGTINATSLFLNGSSLVASQWTANGSSIYYSTGNVGIGTTTPTEKLDVRGNLLLETGDNPVFYTGIGAAELGRYLQLVNSSGYGSASGLKAGGLLVADSYNYANPSKNDLVVKGNVGIGTASPDSKLTVNGTVHAKEVRVDLSVPGPDYVFDEGYELQSLVDLKAYIDANKHLPEVPLAAEMEKNGINLSEMNMLLLKKVEELTLHLIELDKEMTALKGTINKKN